MREGGGTLFVARGFSPFRRVVWTLDGPGVLSARDDFTNAHGVTTATWDADTAVEDDEVTVTAHEREEQLPAIQNGDFSEAGATTHDAAYWSFAAGSNGASACPDGYTEQPAANRGRKAAAGYGTYDGVSAPVCTTATPTAGAGSRLWTFVSYLSGNGCGETSQFWDDCSGGGQTLKFGQISQLVDFDRIDSITLRWGYTGAWNAYTPRFQVYAVSSLSTTHGAWNPAPNASADRLLNVDITHAGDNATITETTIDTTSISGSRYLVIRVQGGASSTTSQWVFVENIRYVETPL